jgi:hypothetical protein
MTRSSREKAISHLRVAVQPVGHDLVLTRRAGHAGVADDGGRRPGGGVLATCPRRLRYGTTNVVEYASCSGTESLTSDRTLPTVTV